MTVIWQRLRLVDSTWLMLVACLAMSGCTNDMQARSGQGGMRSSRVVVEPSVPVTSENVAALIEANTFDTLAGAPRDPAPHDSTDGAVLHAKRDLPVFDAPGGKAFGKLPATQLGSPTWVAVIGRRGEWAEILLPSRPNSSAGWLRADDPEAVEWARTRYEVEIGVSSRRLVVRDRSAGGRRVGVWTVGVGKPAAPTPRGRTFIMASIRETVSHFSPVILPLGTHSETFDSYGGGPGTVALHGWPNSSVFGQASSDGCVRVPNDALRLLTSLPLGTLVLLR